MPVIVGVLHRWAEFIEERSSCVIKFELAHLIGERMREEWGSNASIVSHNSLDDGLRKETKALGRENQANQFDLFYFESSMVTNERSAERASLFVQQLGNPGARVECERTTRSIIKIQLSRKISRTFLRHVLVADEGMRPPMFNIASCIRSRRMTCPPLSCRGLETVSHST